jgi:alkyl hydroperoxide reductase subunit AhpC
MFPMMLLTVLIWVHPTKFSFVCRQENIDFVNHSENFLLKNGKIVNGLLYSDGVHLTKNGTSLLINNINDKVAL